jgi:hypothetical protein
MSNIDLNTAISSLVASEVERALDPYRALLERLAEFAGVPTAVKRGPGRPPKVEGLAVERRRGRRPGPSKGGRGDAARFHAGQSVRYKQGRGIFDATVTDIDVENDVLTLQRAKDGKKVDRPAAKVYEA